MQSYQAQFNKLTEAYIKLEIDPFSPCNCFVGNLLNNSSIWNSFRDYNRTITSDMPIESCKRDDWGSMYEYTVEEVIILERCFLNTFIANNYNQERAFVEDEYDFHALVDGTDSITYEQFMVIQEEALFMAFEATLDVLKEIHTKRGENVEFIPFKKRELA